MDDIDWEQRNRDRKVTKLVVHFERCNWSADDVRKLGPAQWPLVARLAEVSWDTKRDHAKTIAQTIQLIELRAKSRTSVASGEVFE